ncbi:MAG: PE/PPE C-terminal domain-containing protein [Streptosporangiaceae bacterium]
MSAGLGRAVSVGPLSVPQGWSIAGLTTSPTAAHLPVGSVGPAPVNGSAGMPPLMPITGTAGRGPGAMTPQYDMRPTVIPRSPSAG